jgi:hypothetical protein
VGDQRFSRGVISHRRNGQNARTERREIIGGVGSTAGNNLSLAMFDDQDRRFARDTRDFAILELIGDEITEENDRLRS